MATVIRSSKSVNPHHRRQVARPASLRELGPSGSAGHGLRPALLLRGRQAPCTHGAPCCRMEPLHIVAAPRANCFGSDFGDGGRGSAGDPSYPTAEVPLATPLPIALSALGPEALRHCLTAVLPNSTCCCWPVLHTTRRDAIVIQPLGSVNRDRRMDSCARNSARPSVQCFEHVVVSNPGRPCRSGDDAPRRQ